MKISVLVDNNTLIDRYFIGEPGVSFFIKEGETSILFDVGYSNAFLKNAQKMQKNLLNLDYLILSHNHLDHTWGLDPLIKLYTEADIEGIEKKIPMLIGHPNIFNSRRLHSLSEIGSIISETKASRHFKMNLLDKPYWLTDKIVYLGIIPRNNDFEARIPIGEIKDGDKWIGDYIMDDTALAYKSKQGLVVITGCSHAGICNIIDYAQKVCEEEKIFDIIGGFHLQNPSNLQLDGTIEYFKKLQPQQVHACHCTDLQSKIALANVVSIKEVGVGLELSYD